MRIITVEIVDEDDADEAYSIIFQELSDAGIKSCVILSGNREAEIPDAERDAS